MLAAARLRHIAGTKWGTRRSMNMSHLDELKKERAAEQAAEAKKVSSVA
jgi:putative transposase